MARRTRKRFLIDVDEVLSDFQTPVLKVVGELFGRHMTPYDFETWDLFSVFTKEERKALFEVIGRPGFCSTFEPKPGAVEAIQELRQIVDVHPVTRAFPSPTWHHDRTIWLMAMFGFPEPDIVSTASKHLVGGHGFLDDNPEHVEDWNAEYPNGQAMLWHIPNTRTLTQYDHFRVRSWEQVIERVKAL